MKTQKYCYHITDGLTRSALQCGTVTAETMDAAAKIAARRAKLEMRNVARSPDMPPDYRWMTKDGKCRCVYILHNPHPVSP
jgi:hypothetical protein